MLKKWSLRLLLILVYCVAAVPILLLLVVFNVLSDDAAKPEVEAWFAKPPRALPDSRNNGYFVWLGMQVPAEDDPQRVGMHMWSSITAASEGNEPIPKLPAALPMPKLPACPPNSSCLEWRAQQKETADLLQQHRVMLDRYEQLHAFQTISRPLLPRRSLEQPNPISLSSLHKLWVQKQLRLWRRGETRQVLTALAADIRLWRAAGHDATSLYETIYANSFLQDNYDLIAVLHALRPEPAITRTMRPLLQPINGHADMQLVVWSEFRNVWQVTVEDSKDPEPFSKLWYGRLLLQPNATTNQYYRTARRVGQELQLQPPELAKLQYQFEYEDCDFGVRTLRNPAGKILFCLATDNDGP